MDKLISWDAASARLEEAVALAAAKMAKEDERRRREEEGEGEFVEEDDRAIEMYLDSENESEIE